MYNPGDDQVMIWTIIGIIVFIIIMTFHHN